MKATTRAIALSEVWHFFNGNQDVRQAVAASPASTAALVYEDASLREQIVIMVRLLDTAGDALKSDKISYPIVRDLISLPGISEHFIDQARGWKNGNSPDENEKHLKEQIECFRSRLSKLELEEPNRARILRNYRDENIAHELFIAESRPKPLFKYIWDLLPEIVALTEDVKMIAEGANVVWPRDQATQSASALWSAVAAAFPLRKT